MLTATKPHLSRGKQSKQAPAKRQSSASNKGFGTGAVATTGKVSLKPKPRP